MDIKDSQERTIMGGGLFALALSMGALTTALGVLAVDHMALAANLCGPTAGHCLTCVAAVASLVATVVTAGAGLSLLTPDRVSRAAA